MNDKCGVLFADISGSSRLFMRHGDEAAHRMIARCLDGMVKAAIPFEGRLVKTIGDEVMVVFPDLARSVKAAYAMQEWVSDERNSGWPVAVRVGFHFGSVVVNKAGDVYGDAVNVAARCVAAAKAGQVVTTERSSHSLPELFKADARVLDRTAIHGRHGALAFVELVWRDEQATFLGGRPPSASPRWQVHLRWRNQSMVVGPGDPPVSLGRGALSDIQLACPLASRVHLQVVCRHDQILLIDDSTNGTYVRFSDGREEFVCRNDLPLRGEGVISAGVELDNPEADPVAFAVADRQLRTGAGGS